MQTRPVVDTDVVPRGLQDMNQSQTGNALERHDRRLSEVAWIHSGRNRQDGGTQPTDALDRAAVK